MTFEQRRAQVFLFAAEGCSVAEIADFGRVTRSYVRHVLNGHTRPAPRPDARRFRRKPHPEAAITRLVATFRP